MKTLHSFFYLGGLFTEVLCILGVFFFKETAIDGMMPLAFWGFIPTLILYLVFPIKKMVEENLPSEEDLRLLGIRIDRAKWEKETVKNEKERLLVPSLAWILFMCAMSMKNDEIKDMLIVKIIITLIVIIVFWGIIEILTNTPKPTYKQLIHHA